MSRWLLELQAESGGDVPPEIRLRRLLKFAGRTCRLKCVSIRPAQPINQNGVAVPCEERDHPEKPRETNVTIRLD